LGKRYAAHRVVYFLWYGEWPKGEVDHINGDPLDNRPDNLRDTDPSTNCANRPSVGYVVRNGKYRAQIKRGKDRRTATFDTPEEAVAWRNSQRELMYGTDIWRDEAMGPPLDRTLKILAGG
jgi:hypothetical protein